MLSQNDSPPHSRPITPQALPTASKRSSEVQHPFDRLGLVRKNAWIAVFSILVGLLLAIISANLPVGEIAKRMTTRIYAPLLSLGYSSEGQSNITVVTLDDLDLQAYDLTWPVPLDYYQRLIDRLVTYQPRAIFLDVVFLDNRGEALAARLLASVCRAKQAGVPVYLATLARPDGTHKNGIPGLMPVSDVETMLVNAKTPQGVPCVVATLADITADKLDQVQWQYPLARPGAADKTSAALSIFCDLRPAECPQDTSVPLALVWGTKAASTNAQTMVARDATGTLQSFCRGAWNLWEAIPGAVLIHSLALNKPALPLCPYHQVIPIRSFQGKGFSADEMNSALRNKVVMVGGDLAALGDSVVSPIHGKLPGVHVHATALDNLLAFKGAYKQDGEFEWHELWHSKTNLFVIFALVLTTVAVGIRSYLHKKHFLHQESHQHTRQSNSIKLTQPLKMFMAIAWAVVNFFPALLGLPRNSKIREGRAVHKLLADVVLYVGVPTVLLLVGYWRMRQGPLVIIEYVLFPLLAHFTHLGEIFAKRMYLWKSSWTKPRPFAYLKDMNSAKEHGTH